MAPVLAANERDLADGARRWPGPLPGPGRPPRSRAVEVATLAHGMRTLASTPDLLGARVTHVPRRRLVLEQRRVPLGVLGVVFEAHPDALPQMVGLALKSGNALVLKGGKEAQRTNAAMTKVIHGVLDAHGLPRAAVTLLEGRAAFRAFLDQDDLVDLLIARGSGGFVKMVQETTRIPVLGHAEGLCHLYLHDDADPEMAAALAVDAKVSYPAACNAIETLLWHQGASAALDRCVAALAAEGVELRGCAASVRRHPDMVAADDGDWDAEYSEKVLAVRRVNDLEGALEHIGRHGSGHTEAIVAADAGAAETFLRSVDAACVFHNASTRFADGFRFGLGGEVGISTGKLHARGPVGVEGLLTTRWILRGQGDITATFTTGARRFIHEDL